MKQWNATELKFTDHLKTKGDKFYLEIYSYHSLAQKEDFYKPENLAVNIDFLCEKMKFIERIVALTEKIKVIEG